jgi:hypothetical protein
VPIEQGGGSGTAGAHWDEPDGGAVDNTRYVTRNGVNYPFHRESMTGWANSPMFVGAFTCMSLRDGGYNCIACVDDSDCDAGYMCSQEQPGWLPRECVTAAPTPPTQQPTYAPTAAPVPAVFQIAASSPSGACSVNSDGSCFTDGSGNCA